MDLYGYYPADFIDSNIRYDDAESVYEQGRLLSSE